MPGWKKRNTKNVRGPSWLKISATPRLMPVIIEPITITTITPMATPRMVSAARTLLARSDHRAMLTPSKSCVMAHSCRMASTGSSRAALLAG